jgi:hypothetical protein
MFMMKLRYVSSQVLYMLLDRFGVPSRRSMSECTSQACLFLFIWSYDHMVTDDMFDVWWWKKCGCTIGQQRTWLVHSLVMLLSSPNITRPQSRCITVHWWLLARLVRCSYTWFLPLLLLRGMILWSYHCRWICKWWAQLMKPKVQFIFIETFAKDKRVP